MFETESNWSSFNSELIDCIKIKHKQNYHPVITICSSCRNPTQNPSGDHYFHEQGMILCEDCYLDFSKEDLFIVIIDRISSVHEKHACSKIDQKHN